MRVFVLTTGRSGSTTFAKACGHITNFTAGHESNRRRIGWWRTEYPDFHIEVDCRLPLMLGALEKEYRKDAYYVHLKRNPEAVAESMTKLAGLHRPGAKLQRKYDLPESLNARGQEVWAWAGLHALKTAEPIDIARDYIYHTEMNIAAFLQDKPEWMWFELERAQWHFKIFWDWIKAEGDYDAALAEFGTRHNTYEDIFAQSGVA